MAQRRMFNKSITNSSLFLRMPVSSRLLYYDLGMNADDDGFVEHFMVLRMTGATQQDLGILELNGLIKIFDDNVLFIKNWKENNYIQKDRYNASKYLGIYNLDTKCIQNVYTGKSKSKSKSKSNNINKQKYFENEKINNLFIEFLEFRKKLKAQNTDRAIKLLIGKLEKNNEQTQIQMLENSITNSWKGLFEPKIIKQENKPDWYDKEIKEQEDIEKQKKIEKMLKTI